MHPKALMDACTDLVRQVLKFDHSADAVVSQFFKQHRKSLGLGPRERINIHLFQEAWKRRNDELGGRGHVGREAISLHELGSCFVPRRIRRREIG